MGYPVDGALLVIRTNEREHLVLSRILQLLGLGPRVDYQSPEYASKFGEAKSDALTAAIGPPHDRMLHAPIPFDLGGALDLYPFPYKRGGTIWATQEVIEPQPSGGPKRGKLGRYELIACLREQFRSDPPGPGNSPDGVSLREAAKRRSGVPLIQSMLNPIARYSSVAVLNPGETVEIPGDDEDEGARGNLHVVLDAFPDAIGEFRILGERCGLLLCIAIYKSECDFARAQSTAKLLERLKAAGVYPYSDLTRRPVA